MNKGAAGRFRNITNATKPWIPFRRRKGKDVPISHFFLLPFALVGTVALWSSRLDLWAKALWSIPLAVVLVAFAA